MCLAALLPAAFCLGPGAPDDAGWWVCGVITVFFDGGGFCTAILFGMWQQRVEQRQRRAWRLP